MDILNRLPLLAGLSPQQFMQRHWQKKPLLIRQAIPGFKALLSRAALFELAAREDVESRLIVQSASDEGWRLSHGPFARRALPALSRQQWTLLVQGADTHDAAVHSLLQQFRFVPDARLDDVMISFATEGGGVGPHFDSYDVFLLQAHGQRRWRIGRQKDFSLVQGVPLKILENFEYDEEFVLDPGDMLYLPPRYAHDGVALNECMTYSIGFRAPERRSLGQDLLQRMVDDLQDDLDEALAAQAGSSGGGQSKSLYRDPRQEAVVAPAEIPVNLQLFAEQAVAKALQQVQDLPRLLGESLTEPKPQTWFEASAVPAVLRAVTLDRCTRMMFDAHHLYINGESYRAAGRDATLMRKLANQRMLDARDMARTSEGAHALLLDWCDAGWAHGVGDE